MFVSSSKGGEGKVYFMVQDQLQYAKSCWNEIWKSILILNSDTAGKSCCLREHFPFEVLVLSLFMPDSRICFTDILRGQ